MTIFQFNKFCSPAQLYLILAGLGLVLMIFNDFRTETFILHFIFVILFAYILDYLCSIKLTVISWILVFLPWLFLFSTFFLALDALDDQVNIIEGFPNIGSAFSWCDNNKNHKDYKKICSDDTGGKSGQKKNSGDKAKEYVKWCGTEANKKNVDYDSLCNNAEFRRIKKCFDDPVDPQCGKLEVLKDNVAIRIQSGRYKGRAKKLKKGPKLTNGLFNYRYAKRIHDMLDKGNKKLREESAVGALQRIITGSRPYLKRFKQCEAAYCNSDKDRKDYEVQNTINMQAAHVLAAKVADNYFEKGPRDFIKKELNKDLYAMYPNKAGEMKGGINSPFVKEWDKNIKLVQATVI